MIFVVLYPFVISYIFFYRCIGNEENHIKILSLTGFNIYFIVLCIYFFIFIIKNRSLDNCYLFYVVVMFLIFVKLKLSFEMLDIFFRLFIF